MKIQALKGRDNPAEFALYRHALTLCWAFFIAIAPPAAAEPTREEVLGALKKSATFFREKCSHHDGYVWRVSRDLTLSEGEGETSESMIWVQPPGTPAVGAAFLEAYETTQDRFYLEAARDAASALVAGQLQSGGWYYSIEFDPEKRRVWGYRDNPAFQPATRGRDRHNLTLLDDDVTPSALRLLARVNHALGSPDAHLAEALQFGIRSLLAAQAPNGGWRHNWDRYPVAPASPPESADLKASFPEAWPREWPNDWRGVHYLNDNIAANTLATLLLIGELTGDQDCLAAAKKTGDFLLLAQMPEPQPAWAQQYDAGMQPVWDRKFEPPAITGGESQGALEALLLLYRKTGEKKYLEPVPRALSYLRKARLPDGKLARFYELKTNRPLYFKVTDGRYDLVYEADQLPSHYAFIVSSRLDRIEAEYQRLSRDGERVNPVPEKTIAKLPQRVREIIAAMDERGAWIDARGMKGHGKASPDGVIESETFIQNVGLLCRYLRAPAAQ